MSMNLILENGEKAVEFNVAFQKAIGMRPDLQAMRRWYTKGVKSADGSKLKLEIVKVGGRVYTSVEAVQRFISAQSVMPSDEPEVAKPKLAKPDRAARAAGLRRHFPNYAG
jgi:hypothetical protein